MKVESFQIVTSFEQDRSILLSLGPLLKSLEKTMAAKLFQVNAPDDAPPSLPRMVIRMKDGVTMNVCQDRLDLRVSPPRHVAEDIGQAIESLRRIYSITVEPLLNQLSYSWSGVVVKLEYDENPLESNSAIESVYPTFDRLTNINIPKDDLRSFRLMFGFQEEDLFHTITFDGFEERVMGFAVDPNQESVVEVDATQGQLTRCGVSVVYDVNNKKGDKISPTEDLERLIAAQTKAVSEFPKRFSLEDVLK